MSYCIVKVKTYVIKYYFRYLVSVIGIIIESLKQSSENAAYV